MKITKIIVIGGIHGDELTGISLAKYFLRVKNSKISAILCHEKAIKKNKRFIETDLNRSFSKKIPISLEEKLAVRIKQQINNDSIILDFHNTRASGTTSAIVTQEPNNLQIFLTNYFGFSRITQMPSSNSFISKFPQRTISFEIANNQRSAFQVLELRRKIERLINLDIPIVAKKPRKYDYVNKVKRETLMRLNFKFSQIKNFQPLKIIQKNQLGLSVEKTFMPIFYKHRACEEISFTLVEEKNL